MKDEIYVIEQSANVSKTILFLFTFKKKYKLIGINNKLFEQHS